MQQGIPAGPEKMHFIGRFAHRKIRTWQSEPRRLVSAPTSSASKKSTGCSRSLLNTWCLRRGALTA